MSRKVPRAAEIPIAVPADYPPIGLPRPRVRGTVPLESCLQLRRSTRQFQPGVLSLSDVAQMLWASQGVTGLGGLRTAPSAGALYPIRTYLMVARVRGLPVGLFKYDPDDHYIRFLTAGDKREELVAAGMDRSMEDAPASIVLAADYRMAAREFKDNARRLVHIEAGHIGQNACLQATAMGLGAIGLGAIDTSVVRRILGIKEAEEPVYLIAFGKRLDAVEVV